MAAAKKAHATVVVSDPDTGSYLVILEGEDIPERVLDQIDNPVVLGEDDPRESNADVSARLLASEPEDEPETPKATAKRGSDKK